MFQNIAAALAVGVLAYGAASTAQANPILTYDTNPIVLSPGGSVTIDATLSLSPGDSNLITDSSGATVIGAPVGLFFKWQFDLDAVTIGGSPPSDSIFSHNVVFTPGDASQLENLDLAAGDTLALVLGTFTASSSLPVGTYSADVGLYESCPAGVTCLIFVSDPPNFADAGRVTIDVVPEPRSLALFISALIGFIAWRALLPRRWTASPARSG